MEKYFIKFPQINYNNYQVRDISRNVRLSDQTLRIPTLFYPWEVESGLRSDVLAYSYYDDSSMDWLIYITNGIVDPYYGWYLDEVNFENFIKEKYGSIEESMRRIKQYRINWTTDDVDISVSYYDNTLPEALKKYYSPYYGSGSKIISYRRKKDYWYANTNKILRFDITYNSNTTFSNSDFITIYQNDLPVGNCEVITSNTTTVTVQHIQGNTSANNILYNSNVAANATITDTDTVIENITDEEFVYWNAITCFEWERERNEEKKFISLVDAVHSLDISEDLRKKLIE